ncbi:MAG: tRNA lysidine(34) synthetase TilS [Opitutae bacterium]|nr:tRNA lysidine(34) synthetase TilS [Opitutae bacterium]MBT5381015.1 tRNA lysidine(34) synthetase TilS [Opitutae bacterium]MBT5692141.1 tRNA lysidine(34) synthetase TilS [Opitutae bacterium]MBT6463900.1 tRNA lysidine(34) synthetase TilS [Opitutae bacterium]MBT7854340.1 tRNA lysidine(34) synthetase TilS [Opitutae bacterium]
MRQSAEGLLDHFPRGDFESSAMGFLDINSTEPWAVACSGGADSVFLLWLLWVLFPKKKNELCVLHFNHATRGDASDKDEEFVRQLAKGLGLLFYTGRGEVLTDASEAKLRKARLEFFHDKMDEINCRILLQGHQLDDVAETFLMRLSRGSGAGGLAAPRPVQMIDEGKLVHVRPMLTLRRERIRQGLRKCGLDWREDSSNSEKNFFRNRIRADVLPVLQSAAQQDVLGAVARSRRLLHEDDTALDAWASKSYLELKDSVDQIQWPRDLPLAVTRRLLHIWFSNYGKSVMLSADAINNILEAVTQCRETSFSLDQDNLLSLRPDRSIIEIIPAYQKSLKWAVSTLPFGGTLYLPTGEYLQCRRVRVSESLLEAVISGKKKPAFFAFIDPLHLGDNISFLVRTRRPKDRYQPLGMDSPVKLQNLLVNHKVPARIRDHLPVVTLPEGEIVWCPGCPGPENYRLSTASKWAFELEFVQK